MTERTVEAKIVEGFKRKNKIIYRIHFTASTLILTLSFNLNIYENMGIHFNFFLNFYDMKDENLKRDPFEGKSYLVKYLKIFFRAKIS